MSKMPSWRSGVTTHSAYSMLTASVLNLRSFVRQGLRGVRLEVPAPGQMIKRNASDSKTVCWDANGY
jgi:hypothetical protein